jgi:hypothetical protein
METVAILRALWRRRGLVAAALLTALLVGFASAYHVSLPPRLESRSYEVGIATSRILVDTPSSQVVEVSPRGGDTLGTRAGLIASLMIDGPVKAAIARRAGLRPDQFDGISESGGAGSPAVPPPGPRSRVLMTRVVINASGDDLPIIQIEAHAADATRAAKLAEAAVTGLRDYLNSKAAVQRVPDAKRLRVAGLGAPQARDVTRGPRRLFVLIVAIFVFVAGCGAIVVGSKLASAWRAASDEEQAGDEPAEDRSDGAREPDGAGALAVPWRP